MSKRVAKKYYAIHYVGVNENIIVDNWTECQKLTKGRDNMMHGFETKDEAENWLRGITPAKENAHKERVLKAKEIKNAKNARVEYRFYLDSKLSEDFQMQLKKLNVSLDRVLDGLIREYVYGEIE